MMMKEQKWTFSDFEPEYLGNQGHTNVFDQLKSIPGWLLQDNFFVAERIRVFEINGAKHGFSKSGFSQFSEDSQRIFFAA